MTKITINFEPTNSQLEQLLTGAIIEMNPNKVNIGRHFAREYSASLNCPNSFKVKCIKKYNTAEENCNVYDFDHPRQTCGFSILNQLYQFSNGQLVNLTLSGELSLNKGETNLFIAKEVAIDKAVNPPISFNICSAVQQ